MSVLIAIPSKSAKIQAQLVQNLVPQIKDNQFLILAGISPVTRARNIIVDQFLQSDATHLWMIDDDTVPPINALELLMNIKNPIASGITPILTHKGMTSNVYIDTETHEPLSMERATSYNQPVKVAGVGASCLLIEKDFLRKMRNKYMGRVFVDEWTPQNELITEDIVFCNRARSCYVNIVVHPGVVCKHERSVLL